MNSIESSVSQIKTEPSSRLETIVIRATYLPNASFVIEYDQQWLDIFHSFSNSQVRSSISSALLAQFFSLFNQSFKKSLLTLAI